MPDHPRPGDQADQQRGHRRHHGTESDVLEHPQEAELRAQGLQPSGQAKQHRMLLGLAFLSCCCAWAMMACTTRSIFMKREPLTRTLATRGNSASTAALSESMSAKCRPFMRHGLVAEREQLLDALGPGVVAHFGMELRALVADLAHVAQHQQTRPGQLGQHVDSGARRVRVGVVGVVDQGDGAAAQLHAQRARTALDRLEGFQALRDRGRAERRPPARRQPQPAHCARCGGRRYGVGRPEGRRAFSRSPANARLAIQPRPKRCRHRSASPKVMQAREPASSFHSGVNSSSAGNTATPPAAQCGEAPSRFRAPPLPRWP